MQAIAKNHLSLCQALDLLSEGTWMELQQGAQTSQYLGEESVTDYNLMRLAASVPSVVVEKHTKRREFKSGADWEMWTGRSGAFVGLRVQAKILNDRSLRYESLYSSRKKIVGQIDKLINSARIAPKPMYPLLAFYNYASTGPTNLSDMRCPRITTTPLLGGWTVASAVSVRHRLLADPSRDLRNLVDLMLPMSCLFCCPAQCAVLPAGERPSLAAAVVERVTRAWPDSDAESALNLGFGPVYVERLFKGERVETGWDFLPQGIRRGFTRQRELPRGISRVVVVRDLQEIP